MNTRLEKFYKDTVVPQLMKDFGYDNVMQVPRITKISLNMGVGDAKQDSNVLDAASEQLATIAGQAPNVRRAKKSIANFKLRDGMPVGVSVTLPARSADTPKLCRGSSRLGCSLSSLSTSGAAKLTSQIVIARTAAGWVSDTRIGALANWGRSAWPAFGSCGSAPAA